MASVKKGTAPATIDFVATVQLMRLDYGKAAEAAAPAPRRTVTCDVSLPTPMCRERSAARE